ncbi:MAG: precorrin-6y C5,15-methyltransferase (decarboxylating) subunit CbiE [Spirochaetes bacterium]|nr:precorrin-6y C5,15-methyltransferase (decarboxylating) subunit CbiE [Spirochaetota bacterium]
MKINVVGIGPGHPDYITPAVNSVLAKSDVIIAGRRNLEAIDVRDKETIEITGDLDALKKYISENYKSKSISVVASGDPGFYGILGFMKRNFDESDIRVIPGISSMQYIFAKLNLAWENAYLGSVHGKDDDIVSAVKLNKHCFFLTDSRHTYNYIAGLLCEGGMDYCKIIIGINLSYEDELIISTNARNASMMKEVYNLSTVVIINDK